MAPVGTEGVLPETVSCSVGSRRFGDLRGVRWRIGLGILPSSTYACIDDLRRVTADSRRRYAALRKQLLVDPHVSKDESSSPDLTVDNPLSQNPDSMWSRFFRNAELERMVDQDLMRLYPERESYFQTSGCQGMLRRILLLWCLKHPEFGYRQGMHELLAPLLYVLHVDVEHLSEVRKAYEDHFADKFDGFSYYENDLAYNFEFKKFPESVGDGNESEKCVAKVNSLSELDPLIQTIVLLSDAYGAEGELGTVLSEKFMEHDAYSMFDALMSGAGGVVAMAEFFSPSTYGSSQSGYSPVIEASVSVYHLLSVVDSSLHTHLVELGVEPQYFLLRWLRLLFGREFSLENLLLIWDEIFAYDNRKSTKVPDGEMDERALDSPRGAFISAFAVSMILELRSSLLATENATACLQRLLNLPEDEYLVKLLSKAESLQTLSIDVHNYNFLPTSNRGHRLLYPTSPNTPLNVVPESYWEDKWRVLHEEEEQSKGDRQGTSTKKGWSDRVKLRLSRAALFPSPSNKVPSVKGSSVEDLSGQIGSDDDKETAGCCDVEHLGQLLVDGQDVIGRKIINKSKQSHNFWNLPTPVDGNSDQGNESESSVASNSIYENDSESCGSHRVFPPLPTSNGLASKSIQNDILVRKSIEERRTLSGKFQWLWKLGRNGGKGSSDRLGASPFSKSCNGRIEGNNVTDFSTANDASSGTTRKRETVDQNLIFALRNLGESLIENIQVIESVFQDWGQMGTQENSNSPVCEGQITAMSALRELRKISSLLSEI